MQGKPPKCLRRIDPVRALALLLAAATLASIYLALAPVVERAGSASSRNELNPYEILGDRFSNYDFSSEEYDRDNVDWAVNLIFAHGGTIGRVKQQLDDPFDFGKDDWDFPIFEPVEAGATEAHARVNDGPQGSGGEWDEDAGRKTHRCQSLEEPNVFHYRIYAPPDVDHFVNQKWGNYIIGTSHIDHNECGSLATGGTDGTPAFAGRSERAERMVAYHSAANFDNARVFPDKVWLRNWEFSEKANHWWENDGKATFIDVSGK